VHKLSNETEPNETKRVAATNDNIVRMYYSQTNVYIIYRGYMAHNTYLRIKFKTFQIVLCQIKSKQNLQENKNISM